MENTEENTDKLFVKFLTYLISVDTNIVSCFQAHANKFYEMLFANNLEPNATLNCLKKYKLRLAKFTNDIDGEIFKINKWILNHELVELKKVQALTGDDCSNILGEIQNSVEKLLSWISEILVILDQSIAIIESFSCNNRKLVDCADIRKYHYDWSNFKAHIIMSSIIVQKQPPRIIKKDLGFQTSVRFLIGEDLKIITEKPVVKCILISELQMKELYSGKSNFDFSNNWDKGRTSENSSTLLLDPETKHWSAMFKKTKVTLVERNRKQKFSDSKEKPHCVTEDKFYMLYYTNLEAKYKNDTGLYTLNMWTLSLPVVGTTHGSQEAVSLATILWDNAFADFWENHIPFDVKNQIEWKKLSVILNAYFLTQIGESLSPENLDYLYKKLHGNNPPPEFITWEQFAKGSQFRFWEWLYAIVKLIKENLLDHWRDGRIIGFIDKEKSKDMLMECEPGTFLLRFSDTRMGSISAAFKTASQKVEHLTPWTGPELLKIEFSDRIFRNESLRFLYRNIPKIDAFKPIVGKKTVKGYVSEILKIMADTSTNREDFTIAPAPVHAMEMDEMNFSLEETLPFSQLVGQFLESQACNYAQPFNNQPSQHYGNLAQPTNQCFDSQSFRNSNMLVNESSQPSSMSSGYESGSGVSSPNGQPYSNYGNYVEMMGHCSGSQTYDYYQQTFVNQTSPSSMTSGYESSISSPSGCIQQQQLWNVEQPTFQNDDPSLCAGPKINFCDTNFPNNTK